MNDSPAQIAYVKDGECIDIEGDPRSPINAGTLCAKGASTFQLNRNPHRPTQVPRRRPYAAAWEAVALDRIAQLMKTNA